MRSTNASFSTLHPRNYIKFLPALVFLTKATKIIYYAHFICWAIFYILMTTKIYATLLSCGLNG
ncbi:hypothetical protein BKG81_02800 [Mycobacteroides chelonae]|nr:hypothetical protein BKG81_02800 [Mycobacteroides chelonae]